MATPSDLIAHYSTKAFLARMAALTFVGAVTGWTSFYQLTNPDISTLVGVALIVLVASLGELNRRYTHSYLSACIAAGEYSKLDSGENLATAERWRLFRWLNERQYGRWPNRFFLSWLTYLPGIILGEYLVLKNGNIIVGALSLAIGIVILVVWVLTSQVRSMNHFERPLLFDHLVYMELYGYGQGNQPMTRDVFLSAEKLVDRQEFDKVVSAINNKGTRNYPRITSTELGRMLLSTSFQKVIYSLPIDQRIKLYDALRDSPSSTNTSPVGSFTKLLHRITRKTPSLE